MGSQYNLRETNMGIERERERGCSSSSSSSRKGKKNNSSDQKPKQPQRGLGVAQLEKIRLHGQIMPSPHHAYHPSFPTNFTNNNEDPVQTAAYSSSSFSSYSSSPTSYAASYPFYHHPNVVMGLTEYERTNLRYGDSQPRWEHGILETQSLAQVPNVVTRPFLNLYADGSGSRGSSSQNSDSSENQELDLELRLSL